MSHSEIDEIMDKIFLSLKGIKKDWDGKEAIMEMKESEDNNWRQMEWIGFYFEFLCNKSFIENDIEIKKIKVDKVEIDAFYKRPIDLKAHSENNSSKSSKIITNGWEETQKIINKYESIIFVIGVGESIYNDKNLSFKKWHDKLKNNKSKYVQEGERKNRTSRLRKTEFKLNKIICINIDKSFFLKQDTAQKGMRNSNNEPRNAKLLIDLNKLEGVYVREMEL